MNKHWSHTIPRPACDLALDWARTQPSLEVAWQECWHGDWMLWLLSKTGTNRQLLVRAAALCAEPTAALVNKKTEGICLYVVQTCIAWSEGDATDDELRVARTTAEMAAEATAAASWTIEAARAATEAAWTAEAAARAAWAAANAAWAEAAWAAEAARVASLARSADIVRGVFSKPPKI